MSESSLRIELLGQLRVFGGTAEPVSLASARRRALLSYLILHRGAPVPRVRLASLFWPDSEEAQARTNLRRELHHLRVEIAQADEALAIRADLLAWRSGGRVSVDVEEFEALLRHAAEARTAGNARDELGALQDAVALYRGDLLPTVDEDWVEPERERLRAALLASLSRLVELHEARGDLGPAMAHAERMIRLESLDESAYLALVRLHQRAGSRAAAIHAFHRLAGVLRRELDLEPSEATRQAYQELLAAGDVAATPPADTRASVPFVGRDDALGDLRDVWAEAGSLGPTAMVVYGEAGIGKTRLIEEFVRTVQRQAETVALARAYAAEGPVSYGLALDWLRTPAVAACVRQLPAVWRDELGRLAPELGASGPSRPPSTDSTPAPWQRRRLLEAIAHGLLAAPRPLLLVADDLQWADADSLEALHLVTRLDARAQILLVATARTEELPGNARLEELLMSLRYGGRLRERELGRLGPGETALLAREVEGERLSPARLEHIYRLSEGVPLFVVEALRAEADVVSAGQLASSVIVPGGLPPRVRAVLAARLRQLTPDARRLAELAATVGRAFSFDVLEQASGKAEEELVRALDELWRRRIVREQGAGEYDFSHDALRAAAYGSTGPARRRLLHRRVAAALETLTSRASGSPSARIAHHHEHGGDLVRAVEAYVRAAREVSAVFSHEEAVRLLDRAHMLLARLPETADRDRRELELHFAKVAPLRSLGGHTAPALEDAMRRAQELSERLGDVDGLYLSLINQHLGRLVGGRAKEAQELSERLQAMTGDMPDRRAGWDHEKGGALLNVGDLEGSLEHFERSMQRYDPEIGTSRLSRAGANLAVFTAAYQAHALWLYGEGDRALASSTRSVRLARELDHPYSQVVAHAYAAMLHHMRRERAVCLRHAVFVRDLCERYGFAYYVHWGRLFAAWARPSLDRVARVAHVRDAIAGIDREGAAVRMPLYLSVLAIAQAAACEGSAARATLGEAASLVEARGEVWWKPEITRLRALMDPDPGSALAGLQEALRCAVAMKARPLAARAAASLALSLRAAGRTDDARRVLARVLDASPPRGRDRDRERAQRLVARLSA